jgi:RNA-binding protein YhbY
MKYMLKRALPMLFNGGANLHSSQYGEDIYLHKKFRKLSKPGFYVDIGAHHPFRLSNTAYLWAMGWNGLNADASTHTISLFNKYRPGDINLCKAVVSKDFAENNTEICFYYSDDVDNCASCDPVIANERSLVKKVFVPCVSLDELITQACSAFNGEFDLLNIDIEGLDEAVISNIHSWVKRPKILMIEIYGSNIRDVIDNKATHLIESAGYSMVERIGHTAIFELQS